MFFLGVPREYSQERKVSYKSGFHWLELAVNERELAEAGPPLGSSAAENEG